MMHSGTIGAITKALTEARKYFKAVHRNAANPFFKSKYPDLSEIVGATHEALMNHGLNILQSPGSFDLERRTCMVTTLLSHVSGEWISDEFSMPMVKVDPQAVGAAVTYARRYALQAFLNIAADADDDAEAAVEHEKPAIKTPQPLRKDISGETVRQVFQPMPNNHSEDIPVAHRPDDMPANDPPKHPPYIKKQGCISEAQSRRIFAVGASRKQSQQQIREHIAAHGYERTNDIPMGEIYNRICSELELK